jgi:hypothetical protein
MSNRITTEVKAIADAHIAAKNAGKFDNPHVANFEELKKALFEGKTFEKVLEKIETNYCSITSLLMQSSALLDTPTHQYKAGVYKGFKKILQ